MKPTKLLRFLPCVFSLQIAFAQSDIHYDFVGAGHTDGISVSTSSELILPSRTKSASGISTIDGKGLESSRMEAARFLTQAGFGGRPDEIERLADNLDFEAWIENQTEVPRTSLLLESRKAYARAKGLRSQNDDVSNYRYTSKHFHYAWWQSVMTKPDQLRQRVAMALSEILVISTNGPINNHGDAFSSYYDIFTRNAFGNYKDILLEVSLHPAMGVYLTHLRNPKTDTTANTFPDENFAREIMQLFTIGLYELNQDGSIELDSFGNAIPTYDNNDIIELSKVFTGLGAGALDQDAIESGRDLRFSTHQNDMDYTVQMQMYEDEHEPGEKHLLNGFVIPSGLTGMEDIELAVIHLFNHKNTGPFIARKLIQHLIKSNPSPTYISDVAAAFNENEDGIRGDMLHTIKTILLHEEARDCLWQTESTNGKLLPPTIRWAAFARSMELRAPEELFYTEGNTFYDNTFHRVLSAPSVFNFYAPDHMPNGVLSEMGLVAPEFEIFNSVTSIGYLNRVDRWTDNGDVFTASELEDDVEIVKSYYHEMARDPEVLINYLDRLLTKGRLRDETRTYILEALEGLPSWNESNMLRDRFEIAAYIVMISPEFNILK